MQKRCKEEILSKILEICCQGVRKTAIVYGANLNFRTVNPYIELLSKNGLIEIDQGSYRTTPRGNETLKNMRIVQSELVSL
jgi:predicted transcriptional regulator